MADLKHSESPKMVKAGGYSRPVLVVGAGFAGAVAARLLADAGIAVVVIDRRNHIGGNAYDEVDSRGVRVHRYGPHLFHTNNMAVVRWLSDFTEWTLYEHRVRAMLPDGQFVPLPINRRTLSVYFAQDLPTSDSAALALSSVALSIANPRNAEEALFSRIGRDLTELFYERYTRKMWDISLSDLDASVVKRIPIRTDDEDRYFASDRFQALPKHGYAAIFDAMLKHELIDVRLETPFEKSMLKNYSASFLCMPIDEFFDFCFGELPYRSIRFHHEGIEISSINAPTPVVNFTDTSVYTRATYWHKLPGHWVNRGETVTRTMEEPCDYRDNGLERYYPIKTADGRYQRLYERYADLAAQERNVTFLGRCGTYQYLDMDQVVNQTLQRVGRWISDRKDVAGPAPIRQGKQ